MVPKSDDWPKFANVVTGHDGQSLVPYSSSFFFYFTDVQLWFLLLALFFREDRVCHCSPSVEDNLVPSLILGILVGIAPFSCDLPLLNTDSLPESPGLALVVPPGRSWSTWSGHPARPVADAAEPRTQTSMSTRS
jgi:hypothetical protein